MWCLPTYKRPQKLRRFLHAMAPQDRGEVVLLMIWRNDPMMKEYQELFGELPSGWEVILTPGKTCGEKLNHAFDLFPEEPFYGLLADDTVLASAGMLHELKMEAMNGRFAWPNDGVHGPRMATHPCAPGKMIRALGFWAHPRFPQNGLDVILYRVSEALSLSKYRSDLHLIHFHPSVHLEEFDEVYAEARGVNSQAEVDMYDFQADVLPQLIAKVKSVYAQKEVKCEA